jgi:phytol kinase
LKFPPVVGIVMVLGALGGLIGGIWLLTRTRAISPELSRKGVHVGMGLLVLTFPWLFDQTWPVIVLAALAIGSLLLLRLERLRKEGPGRVLLSVERSSLGDLYFPLVVAVLFALSQRDLLLYAVPLLVLTLADASAALIGRRWGRHGYTTSGGRKTYEGSAAFFIVTFCCVAIPLVVWRHLSPLSAAFLATMVAAVVCALEAISLEGRDNLYVPFAVYVLLKICMGYSPQMLLVRLVVLLLVLVLVVALRRRTTLDDAALLGSGLTAYAAVVVGGWMWLLPPVLLFLAYTNVFPNCYPETRGAHNIHAVVSVTAAGYLYLCLFAASRKANWFVPYAISYGDQLAMVGVASLAATRVNRSIVFIVAQAGLLSSLITSALLAFLMYVQPVGYSWEPVAASLALCGGCATAFAMWQPVIRDCPVDASRWLRQGVLGVLFSVPAILLSGNA